MKYLLLAISLLSNLAFADMVTEEIKKLTIYRDVFAEADIRFGLNRAIAISASLFRTKAGLGLATSH